MRTQDVVVDCDGQDQRGGVDEHRGPELSHVLGRRQDGQQGQPDRVDRAEDDRAGGEADTADHLREPRPRASAARSGPASGRARAPRPSPATTRPARRRRPPARPDAAAPRPPGPAQIATWPTSSRSARRKWQPATQLREQGPRAALEVQRPGQARAPRAPGTFVEGQPRPAGRQHQGQQQALTPPRRGVRNVNVPPRHDPARQQQLVDPQVAERRRPAGTPRSPPRTTPNSARPSSRRISTNDVTVLITRPNTRAAANASDWPDYGPRSRASALMPAPGTTPASR